MMSWRAAAVLPLLVLGCGHEVRTDPEVAPATAAIASNAGYDGVEGADGTGAQAAEAGFRLTTVLFSEHDAEIRARMDGVVRSVRFELGDRVGAGQVLAALEDDRERADVEAATATAERARAEHERAMRLREQEILAQAELEDVIHRARVADATLRAAEARLEFTQVRAPFAGVVTSRVVRPGQNVLEGDPLYRVTVMRPLHALLRVPELDARALARGHRILLRGLDGVEAEGVISRIAPAVDTRSGTVEVRVDVPEPGALRPGSTVVVEIERPAPPDPAHVPD